MKKELFDEIREKNKIREKSIIDKFEMKIDDEEAEDLPELSDDRELEIEKKKIELAEEEEKLKKKMMLVQFKESKVVKKEKELIEKEKELADERELLRQREFNMQDECDKQARRISEEIVNRNIELNKRLGDLNKLEIENTTLKYELDRKDNEIKMLKKANYDLNSQISIYESNKSITEILDFNEKLAKINQLESENLAFKEEIISLKRRINELINDNDGIEAVKNANEILRNRIKRRESEIHYLKKLEMAKGTGEDGSQKIFEEIIEQQIESDKKDIKENYCGDERLVRGFIDFCKDAGFIYEENLVRGFLASLRSSRLTILKGYSGTGKSSLPNLFAMYLNAECVVIPVQPNWRTKQDIMGFYNYFTNKFIPTELTQTLLRANVSKDRIFFIVLDEMNLARVEYYFSEFNSKLWLDDEQRKIELYEGISHYDGEVSKYIKDNSIFIPDNVYFIGTINEDDSVSPISDKIFDRAQVIEFMQLPSSKFAGSLDDAKKEINKTKYTSFRTFNRQLDEDKKVNLNIIDSVNEFTKNEFNKVIGFRSLSQAEKFIKCFINAGGSEKEALDMQLVSKFVPKFKSVSSENDIFALEELIEKIRKLFESKFKCSEEERDNLQVVVQLKSIIDMLGE